MVSPFSKATFHLEKSVKNAKEVEWTIIDDFGTSRKGVTRLN